MHKLTAKEIKHLDEINADRISIDRTLDIAMTYHSNRMNELHRSEKEWWNDLVDKHGFNPAENWKVKHIEGAVYIVKDEK